MAFRLCQIAIIDQLIHLIHIIFRSLILFLAGFVIYLLYGYPVLMSRVSQNVIYEGKRISMITF